MVADFPMTGTRVHGNSPWARGLLRSMPLDERRELEDAVPAGYFVTLIGDRRRRWVVSLVREGRNDARPEVVGREAEVRDAGLLAAVRRLVRAAGLRS